MEKKKIILIAVALFVIVCVYFIFEFFIGGLDKSEVVSDDYIVNDVLSTSDSEDDFNDESDEGNTDSNDNGDDSQEDIASSGDMRNDENLDEKIYVYVTGEVNNNGVVILNEGARITDAINAAGGTTTNADISKINLVYILTDGVKLNIPSFNDLKENPDFEYIILGSGEGSLNSESSSSSSGVSSAESTGSSTGKIGSGISSSKQVVNINSASQTELELLPGIGPSLALKIIEYRNENGKFSKIEDIKNVKGIGDARFDDLKDFITV